MPGRFRARRQIGDLGKLGWDRSLQRSRKRDGQNVGNASGKHLQLYRAIEILEKIGTPAAAEVLDTLAKGQPGSRLSDEAAVTLGRIRKAP